MSKLSIDVQIPPEVTRLLNGNFKDVVDGALKDTTMEASNITKETITEMGIVKTGNLRRSIEPEYDGSIGKVKTGYGEGATPAKYWRFIQYGTSKMEARPFATRTAEKIKSKQVFSRAVTKQLQQRGYL